MSRPYLLFFPLGALLGALGVSHWILYTRGMLDSYQGQGHALLQVQGFLLAFACGFLLTMIPRHSGGSHPSRRVLIAIGALLLVGSAAALRANWWVSQMAFVATLLLLAYFLAARLGRRMLRKPFLLVTFGLACGLVGGTAIALASLFESPWLLPLARALVQEGLFLGLTLGVGQILHGAVMADPGRKKSPAWVDPVVTATLCLSFVAQGVLLARDELEGATRIGEGLRALSILAVLWWGVQAQRRPAQPGNHRVWVWLSFWLLPIGPLAAALWPSHRTALLHMLFVGGFSLMVFAIGHHVVHAHGGQAASLLRKNWRVRVFGALFVFAMVTRVSSDLLPASYWAHIEGAAIAWLLALVLWLWGVFPALRAGWRQEHSVGR